MSYHHLLSINEDQLRNWQGDPDDLLRNIGSAVVLACLEADNDGVTIHVDASGAGSNKGGSVITVSHVDKREGQPFAVWAWAAGDDVCIADLSKDDLALLGKLSNAVLQGHVIQGDEP